MWGYLLEEELLGGHRDPMRSWGWAPPYRISVHTRRGRERGLHSHTQGCVWQRALTQNRIFQHLDLGLPSLQDCEKINVCCYRTLSSPWQIITGRVARMTTNFVTSSFLDDLQALDPTWFLSNPCYSSTVSFSCCILSQHQPQSPPSSRNRQGSSWQELECHERISSSQDQSSVSSHWAPLLRTQKCPWRSLNTMYPQTHYTGIDT